MAVDERRRHQLHTALSEKLGPDAAATLMELVPPVGWADVATKRDLSTEIALLEARLGARLEARLNSQTKTLVGVLIASNATLAAIAFVAARLS
jgi:hypothetical protein